MAVLGVPVGVVPPGQRCQQGPVVQPDIRYAAQ